MPGLARKACTTGRWCYTGTIGMKHDPQQIVELARQLRSRPRAAVVVVSEGPAAEWLAGQAKAEDLGALRVLPFQPFEVYSDVLGSADVVISVLEPDAGSFSVPSKVLSYLCAGRAIVLSAPTTNLAARIIAGEETGAVVPPGDAGRFAGEVLSLLDDPDRRAACAASARRYAERAFSIGPIADRFETVFRRAQAARS